MEKLLVLDASVAIKAILPNPLQGHCRSLVSTFAETQPVAPALWAYETTSALTKAVHFGQINVGEAYMLLEQIALLGVELFATSLELNHAAFAWTLKLKRPAVYGSYYLALAQNLDCPFWTADSRLFNALKDQQCKWLHWIEEISPLP
jgi:predicted nucleic acid-binding protein